MIKVIDVSKYQGRIDWPAVKASGVVGAEIRAVDDDGLSPDPMFETNWRGAKEVGLNRSWYSIFYPWLDPGQAARNAVEIVRARSEGDWWMGEWRPAVDAEPGAQNLPAREMEGRLLEQLQTIEALILRRPMIYTSARCWQFIDPYGQATWAKDYLLWVANYWYPRDHYTTWEMFETLPKTMPLLPPNWTQYDLWQWAGDDGVNDGVYTKCDLDIVHPRHAGRLNEVFAGVMPDVVTVIVSPETPPAPEPEPAVILSSPSKWQVIGDLFRAGKISEALYRLATWMDENIEKVEG